MNERLKRDFEEWKSQPGNQAGEVTSSQIRQATQKLKQYDSDGVPLMTAALATFLLQYEQ
ncbi:hypothetical protein CY658_21740 [Variovorax sp. RO1]|uniref:hypothetical protein n=1 Tax=Variovorax sp. RO1 TaxID=2066034 RepID=UPI000C717274|nr:hypothetical protein [Variovorax sp. RO1]PLC03441.1 hypothetical protein CY658_21740 [Variovorax sp. RO1]